MIDFSKLRGFSGLIVSIGIHLGFVIFLISLPKDRSEKYDIVDMSVQTVKKPAPEPELPPAPEPEPEPEQAPEPVKKRAKPKAEPIQKAEPPPPPPEAAEPPPPPEAEEAPPVFDLGDNTFAQNGQGAGWSMNRSEGNTRFAGVAKKGQSPVRKTKPKFAEKGKPTGSGGADSGDAPVPLANLSKRPELLAPVETGPYPSEAKRAGIEGPVVLRVLVDKSGKVKRTQVLKSPSELLSERARIQIAKAQFSPALDKSGKPVDTVIVYTFRFVLDG